ncbi:MAG: hypothetical protein K9M45_10975 [Kiritimatiellales bacterium]|nr:hypothetical protein [Kiritimatiellales bacterium]
MTKLKAFLSWLKEWQGLIAAALFFVGLFLGATGYIDSRIKKTVTESEFLSRLARRIQPSLIIDQNKTIEADLGACEYIDSINFVVNTNLDTVYNLSLGSANYEFSLMKRYYPIPNQIIVTPKQHLAYAPMITPLPPFTFDYSTHRGEGHSWVYEISYITGYPEEKAPPLRVKVDIIK